MDFLPTAQIGQGGVAYLPSEDGTKLAVRIAGRQRLPHSVGHVARFAEPFWVRTGSRSGRNKVESMGGETGARGRARQKSEERG